MTKAIIFKTSFLVSGIMCFDGCGQTIQRSLNQCITGYIEEGRLPADARLIVDAEPYGLGIHQLILSIESETDQPTEDFHAALSHHIQQNTNFDIIDHSEEAPQTNTHWTNGINILINLIAMGGILAGAWLFPPSVLLTVSLTTLSFLSSAFTSRQYLLTFVDNCRTKNFTNMATTISLGWLLSLTHTLYHTITMPMMATQLSMVFMGFIMPLMLITCINAMDEIKRLIMEKSKNIQIKGIKTLFPQMSDTYRCYSLPQEEMERLLDQNHSTPTTSSTGNRTTNNSISFNQTLFQDTSKNLLREGMLILIKPGECFPVDCLLVGGNTMIDASLLTGESQQNKQPGQDIPAGAIHLGQSSITVYARKSPYNSTVNSLLFRSNRARQTTMSQTGIPPFIYFYSALIFVGMIGAILIPVALNVATFSLIMQNMIGILFSICPCTIAIAHQLPQLISLHHRSTKGIHLRDEALMNTDSNEIHTIVFDKTGTLTTGHSMVESSSIPVTSPLWQKIYWLEKEYGRGHPLARAILAYNDAHSDGERLSYPIESCHIDKQHRGLEAHIQGKTLQIGSVDYLKEHHIDIPKLDESKIKQGFSVVCIAEEGQYQGVIYIQHEVRQGVLTALKRLKDDGKKIILLTGDNPLSAKGFNQQLDSVFNEADIHAGQTPQNKEAFLNNLISSSGTDPRDIWFCGDGLNDAPCCRIVSEKGGISCAMSAHDKSAFFTDISLNGSLDYLFTHHRLNHFLQQNIAQNKGILIYGALAFLAFIISFPIAGIAVPPLILMTIMLSTTLFILFNAYRTQLAIDHTLDTVTSWAKQHLSSNLSIGLLLGASILLMCSVLVATIATGGLTLPLMTFTTGVAAAFSSVCTLSAIGLFSAFATLLTTVLFEQHTPADHQAIPRPHQQQPKQPYGSLWQKPSSNSISATECDTSHDHAVSSGQTTTMS